jgi:thiol:disulfide interchange protein DsbD
MCGRGIWAGVVACLLLTATAVSAEPFEVEAELVRVDSGDLNVVLTLSVEKDHYVYADQVSVEVDDDAELVPVQIPKPKRKDDPFTGEIASIYDHDVSFRYAVKGDVPEPLELKVSYQGCSQSLCFLPVTETFSLSAVVGGERRGWCNPTRRWAARPERTTGRFRLSASR